MSYYVKSDREVEISYDIAYMWNLKKKNDTNELTKQKETYRLRDELRIVRGRDGGDN